MGLQHLILLLLGISLLGSPALALRTEVLSENPKYIVSWEIQGEGPNATATFEVNVATTGYVGFGISKTGGMGGADIVVGGVFPNGTSYFSDRHGTEVNGFPPEDLHQDWSLLAASENGTHTTLKFSRLVDTCDEQDVPILLQTQRFIHAVGEDDNITYHGALRRGAFSVSILGEPYPDVDLSKYNAFDAVMNVTMLPQDTIYWCTVHKAPVFNGKQHAVAFTSVLNGPLSVQHTHHLSLYSCKVPNEETDPQEFFDKYVAQGGVNCLDHKAGEITPTAYSYCKDLVYTWTIGGRIMLMPDDVGFPIGEEEHMYYLMESHLDNPNVEADVTFESGVRIYYSEELRRTEAGVMRIGQMYDYNFIVPPNSEDYLVVGHCSANCTRQWVPTQGVNIFNIMLHSHACGRKMKLRQFRNGLELPWVINDENYDNNYQDNRNVPLTKFLPGDHFSIECQYDNTFLSPAGSVVGGFGTREEMCEVVYYYYPRMGLENCRSTIEKKHILAYFGIESVQEFGDTSHNPMITAPANLAGLRLLEYIDSLEWTQMQRNALQQLMRHSLHVEQCGGDGFQKSAQDFADTYYVTYPQILEEYVPPETDCPANPFKM